jgi:hypothetical protein
LIQRPVNRINGRYKDWVRFKNNNLQAGWFISPHPLNQLNLKASIPLFSVPGIDLLSLQSGFDHIQLPQFLFCPETGRKKANYDAYNPANYPIVFYLFLGRASAGAKQRRGE